MSLTLKFNVVAPKPHSCAQFFLYRSKAGLSKVGNNYESIRQIFQNCYGLVGIPKERQHSIRDEANSSSYGMVVF